MILFGLAAASSYNLISGRDSFSRVPETQHHYGLLQAYNTRSHMGYVGGPTRVVSHSPSSL